MKKKLFVVIIIILIVMGLGWAAGLRKQKNSAVVADGAWNWIADPRAVYYENKEKTIQAVYVGYIDVHGNVKASQYDFLSGKRTEVLVRSGFQPDDHNNPVFLALPDGRILIIYTRHTDEPAFYYRVSEKAGDISKLGAENRLPTSAYTTYPTPFILQNDPEHFYLLWRGINWHPTIARLTLPDADDKIKMDWGPHQIVQSTGARPYPKYFSNGKDKIYMAYTTGYPDDEYPDWLYFNVINIGASEPWLEDIKGNILADIGRQPFAINKSKEFIRQFPFVVVDSPNKYRDWIWSVSEDDDGKPVIALVRISEDKQKHTYFYAKWTGRRWRLTELTPAGGRFHRSDTEYCYSGGLHINPQNPKEVYVSVPTEGKYGTVFEIWKYILDKAGKITKREQITADSQKNNVRPYVIPAAAKMHLVWMSGDYYYWLVRQGYPLGYPTQIRSDYAYKENIRFNIWKPLMEMRVNGMQMNENRYEEIKLPPQKSFTLDIELMLDEKAYYGTILRAKNLSYGIMPPEAKPYIEINGRLYPGSNGLYVSDNWAANSWGTHGDVWRTLLKEFNLTFVYDGKTLTVYRNGLLDQQIDAPDLQLDNMRVGGYTGILNHIIVYEEALTQDEIKFMLRRQKEGLFRDSGRVMQKGK